jgi:hypothetical protein
MKKFLTIRKRIVFFTIVSIAIVLLGVVLYKAAKKGFIQYRIPGNANKVRMCSIDTDCPPNHICVKGLCVPESKLDEFISLLG